MSRPLKKTEYELVHITRQAETGWRDVLATSRNATIDAWDRLTSEPTREDGERVYRLKGDLAQGSHEGVVFDRFQYKLPGGARIWYFVEAATGRKSKSAGRVLIEDVHTAHPNETK